MRFIPFDRLFRKAIKDTYMHSWKKQLSSTSQLLTHDQSLHSSFYLSPCYISSIVGSGGVIDRFHVLSVQQHKSNGWAPSQVTWVHLSLLYKFIVFYFYYQLLLLTVLLLLLTVLLLPLYHYHSTTTTLPLYYNSLYNKWNYIDSLWLLSALFYSFLRNQVCFYLINILCYYVIMLLWYACLVIFVFWSFIHDMHVNVPLSSNTQNKH